MPATRRADAARTRCLTYDVAGQPGAPVIVFAHGTRLSRGMWAAQLRSLAAEYRVVAVDLPGHGALAAEPFTLDAAADVLANAIGTEAGSDGRAIVVGLSLGGYVGMHLAANRPDLVRGLVLSGATTEPDSWRSTPVRALAWALDHVGHGVDRLDAASFRARYPADIADPIVEGGLWYEGGAQAVRALAGEHFLPRLARYGGPVLLINGEWDPIMRVFAPPFVRAAHAADTADRPDRVRWVRIAGATHLVNLDRPTAFDAAIRSFAASLVD
jgi:pimeloyl-ACP methyl ester carboxylesterase